MKCFNINFFNIVKQTRLITETNWLLPSKRQFGDQQSLPQPKSPTPITERMNDHWQGFFTKFDMPNYKDDRFQNLLPQKRIKIIDKYVKRIRDDTSKNSDSKDYYINLSTIEELPNVSKKRVAVQSKRLNEDELEQITNGFLATDVEIAIF